MIEAALMAGLAIIAMAVYAYMVEKVNGILDDKEDEINE